MTEYETIKNLKDFYAMRKGFAQKNTTICFSRALGGSADLVSEITGLERTEARALQKQGGAYLRIKSLPVSLVPEDVSFYTKLYQSYKYDSPLCFKEFTPSKKLENVIRESLAKVCRLFREKKTGVTDSMLSNFGVKLLFWTDTIFSRVLTDNTEKAFLKLAVENVEKEQEYLFWYFLALTGCEVLLLQTKKDVPIRVAFLELSDSFTVGAFGQISLPEYEAVTGMQVCAQQEAPRANIKMTIPPRNRKKAENIQINVAGMQACEQPEGPRANTEHVQNVEPREKSFEELARLASSVVMIAVHDPEGNVLGTGSGIMIATEGYILTNFHVAERGRVYSVRIENDDQIYQTDELIKYHPDFDLALLRINRTLKPLPVYSGRKELVRGQKVVAIGSPLGMFNSVSDGIISGFRRFDDLDMIQFTAPISNGSSGGAVLNMYGEVIGISTAGLDDGQNLNLAVGYENIRRFAGNFIK